MLKQKTEARINTHVKNLKKEVNLLIDIAEAIETGDTQLLRRMADVRIDEINHNLSVLNKRKQNENKD